MATELKFSKSELDAIVGNAQELLNDILAKGDEGSKSDKAPEASASGSGSGSAGGSPAGAAPASDSAPAPAADAAPAPSAGPSSDPANAIPDQGAIAPDADPAAAQGVSPEQLVAEYAQLDPATLEAHLMAAKSALEQKMAAQAGPAVPGGAPAGSPTPSPSPSAPPMAAGPGPGPSAPPMAPPQPPMPAFKSEAATAELAKLTKSNADLEAKLADMGKQMDLVVKSLTTMNGPKLAAIRKSLTGTEATVAAGSTAPLANLSKSEVKALVRKQITNTALTKHDRELISGFLMDEIPVQSIAHLLKS